MKRTKSKPETPELKDIYDAMVEGDIKTLSTGLHNADREAKREGIIDYLIESDPHEPFTREELEKQDDAELRVGYETITGTDFDDIYEDDNTHRFKTFEDLGQAHNDDGSLPSQIDGMLSNGEATAKFGDLYHKTEKDLANYELKLNGKAR